MESARLNLQQEAAQWKNSEDYARGLRDRFTVEMNWDDDLAKHREFCGNGIGMGEDAFHWMYKLIVDEMPDPFRFLEVGVYKGQVPSLIRLLANKAGKEAEIYGVTLLSSFAGSRPPHPDHDYLQSIQDLHDNFGQPMPTLIVGDSTSDEVHEQVSVLPTFDAALVDACHDYGYVLKDLLFYGQRVKVGGYLICDDAACNLKQPWGFFQGIEDVTRAVQTVIETSRAWEHVITVCHDRVFRRIA